MKASIRLLIDVSDEQTLTELADQAAATLAEHATVLATAQALEDDLYTVLWVPEHAPQQGAETEQVYAADAADAKDRADEPGRLIIGAARGELQLE